MSLEWATPGTKAAIYTPSGGRGIPADCDIVTIERLTKTQIITGRYRFSIETGERIGSPSRWVTPRLIPVDDPRVAEAAEWTRISRLRHAALNAVDTYKHNAGKDREKARLAANALLAYANSKDPS
jgi:hypothetical protein